MEHSYLETYAGFLRGFASPARRIAVVFDFSNGATELVVPRVLAGVPHIAATLIDRTLSGNFPAHGPNPMAARAQFHLHEAVLKHRADIGVIFDADGDRVFFVDHRGRSVPAYVIATLLAKHEEPPYIFDTRTYYSLEKTGMLDPGTARLSAVGSFFIRKLMREARAGFGAEYSGHYYFKEFFRADSGILAALKVINAVTRLPYTLADYVDLLPRELITEEMNIRVANPAAALKKIRAHYRKLSKRTKLFDGVTLDFGDWFLAARPSNTEPLIRLFAGSGNALLLRGRLRECERLVTASQITT
jgi:phosphomannomutase